MDAGYVRSLADTEFGVVLKIRKRRFYCRRCQRPFTEPVPGIMKGKRFTERYCKSVLWACENFSSLKAVLQSYRCSAGFLYKTLYAELARKQRTRQGPWPKVIGIDEHYFGRNQGFRQFVTVVVNMNRKRLMEVALGKRRADLEHAFADIPGRDNVQQVVCDLAEPYRGFAKTYFPNATVVADKFHVLRLLNPAINSHRKQITGDKRTHPLRRLLLRNGYRLPWHRRHKLARWLEDHPALAEVYYAKESLHRLYRCKGIRRAERNLTRLTDTLAKSSMPALKTLRRTLMRWRAEILAYFRHRLTNARTEGFNNVAKVVKKRAYGYKSFANYRLRLLTACS